MPTKNPVVYSTEFGRFCEKCGQPKGRCQCDARKVQPQPSADGFIRVRREKKGRKGKEVTLVRGVPGTLAEVQAHLTELKKKLGTGGAYKDGVLEIQGDRTEGVIVYFTALGLKIKKEGG